MPVSDTDDGWYTAGSQVIFRVRRPFYFINSSIFVEDGEGNTMGEVQQRWHLWQRNYDLYIDRKQYATINSGLWAWEFLLKDRNGGIFHLFLPSLRLSLPCTFACPCCSAAACAAMRLHMC